MGPTGHVHYIEIIQFRFQSQQIIQKVYKQNSTLNHMRFTVILEKDEDNIYVATVPALPGCISDGRTVEEAMLNIKEAIQGYIDDIKSDGEPIPRDMDIIGNVELNA